MITLDTVEIGALPASCLAGFKSYAAISDDSQDMLLVSLLTRAMLRVQEMANRSLLSCKFHLEDDEVVNGLVRLYQNVKEVEDVRDGAGRNIPYTRASRTLSVGSVDSVVVEYTTEANEAAQYELMPIVYQYATALFDGQDSRSLAAILMQCR